MNATTTIQPGTVRIKRTHLVGLIVGVAALSVGLSSVTRAVFDSSSERSSAVRPYAEAVDAMTPEAQAAIFGNMPVYAPKPYVDGVTAMTAGERAALWGNVPVANPQQDYLDGVSAMTPAERTATWGNVPVANPQQDYLDGVSAMTPAERTATWGTTFVGA